MSTRRASRQDGLRSRPSPDGLGDISDSGPQPSRRSSRQRTPTSKVLPDASNTASQASSGTDQATTGNEPRARGNAAAKQSSKPEEKRFPSRKSDQSKNKTSIPVEDKKQKQAVVKRKSFEGQEGLSNESLIGLAVERLVHIDSETYNENIMMDADILLDRIILPMSFPWCHDSTLSVKNVPCDIDELPGVLFAGRKPQGTMYGRGLRNSKSETCHSSDAGVVEVKLQTDSAPKTLDDDEEFSQQDPLPTTTGELKLSSFRAALSRKKRRLDQVSSVSSLSPSQVKLVSFSFGSASSRASIFPNSPLPKKRTILLGATYSEDFQRGKRIKAETANAISKELGSYDYRYGLPPMDPSSGRIRAGRTRLIWSTKHLGGSRPTYRSMLTNIPLEGGSHKRPISIKVSVRFNGQLLERGDEENTSSSKFTEEEIEAILSNAGNKTRNERKVSPTIDVSQTSSFHPQCSLDTDKVVAERAVESHRSAAKVVRDFAAAHRFEVDVSPEQSFFVQPPIIQSIPTEDGTIRTICTKSGFFSNSSTGKATSPVDTSLFLANMSARSMACAVCWSPDIDREDICVCSGCGLRAHFSCHPGNLSSVSKNSADQRWNCSVCNFRKSGEQNASVEEEGVLNNDNYKQCNICPVIGGITSPDANGREWSHDVCRTWCSRKEGTSGEIGECVLCSTRESRVIRCAAKGCSVTFHPMCAVFVSQAAMYNCAQKKFPAPLPDIGNDLYEHQVKDSDMLQCLKYRLVTTRIGVRGRKKHKSFRMHLGFCGIHNSERLPEFHGLPPGGSCYQDAFRVPPLSKEP